MSLENDLLGFVIESTQIERLQGTGGYGYVFLAHDVETDSKRIVKVSRYPVDDIAHSLELKSFIDEGHILDRLNHPQIVRVRRLGTLRVPDGDEHKYMILDFIQGITLYKAINLYRTRCQELACKWQDLFDPLTGLALICSALEPLSYAHGASIHLHGRDSSGIAHRDISPANLMLGHAKTNFGRIILIDFGSAKADSHGSVNMTINPSNNGTVPYMNRPRLEKPPESEILKETEQFWSSYRDTRFDVHAMGAILFELLQGELAFTGEGPAQIISSILNKEKYERCYRTVDKIHPSLGNLIRKSLVYLDPKRPLEKQPYQFPNAGEFCAEANVVLNELLSQNGRDAREFTSDFVLKTLAPHSILPLYQTGKLHSLNSANKQRDPSNLAAKKNKHRVSIAAASLTIFLAVATLFFFLNKSNPKVHPSDQSETLQWDNLASQSNDSLIINNDSEKLGGIKTSKTSETNATRTITKAKSDNFKSKSQPQEKQVILTQKNSAPVQKKIPSREELSLYRAMLSTRDYEGAYHGLRELIRQFPHNPDLKVLLALAAISYVPKSPEAKDLMEETKDAKPVVFTEREFQELMDDLIIKITLQH